MKIYYAYVPEVCSFRIGAKSKKGTVHWVQLQSWMEVKDVIKALKMCVAEVKLKDLES